ncbi:ABC transporter ATP-binding protein [Cephaloticoccus primus]|uniref:ABC transporter ATP-binding protein n=1 Tax=Cephaloticoccus primus TaxID=1548207 RepID=UPI00083867A9|nr:ABC transporter ATP-binding protein [Cephaloticoccus primus]
MTPHTPEPTADAAPPILTVKDLVTTFDTDAGRLTAVDGVSFSVRRGRTLGLVGESGCGKSVTACSIMRLLPQPMGRIASGQILFDGQDLVTAPPEHMLKVRGGQIGMIFQEPMTALNPVHTIGRQLSEVFLLHRTRDRREALALSAGILAKVGIPSPEVRLGEYPHQLSGGMRQRVVIAMALACKPAVVIADEPTTALDVTIQAQILELMQSLQREMGMAILLITHDLGVIAEMCDDIVVMYAGRIAEAGPVEEIFAAPRHPYTRGLLDSIPRLSTPRKARLNTIEGMVPGLADMPTGCRYQNRCPWRADICASPPPEQVIVPAATAPGTTKAGPRDSRENPVAGTPCRESRAADSFLWPKALSPRHQQSTPATAGKNNPAHHPCRESVNGGAPHPAAARVACHRWQELPTYRRPDHPL